MLIFYKYRKHAMKCSFKKAQRYVQYLESYGKWYFVLKFCQRNTLLVPHVHSWHWRSLYVHKRHINDTTKVKKVVLLHLFWILDIWKLKHPLSVKGLTTYPVAFYANISYKNPLELYGTIHRWKYKFGLKKTRLFPYILTKVWKDYISEQWTTRSYLQFITWRKKNPYYYYKRFKEGPFYDCLNFWFLTNRYFHNVQGRLYCKTSRNPHRYTKTLWLRLLQYPSVYDHRWFSLLKHLTRYKLREQLPWDLVYTSRDTWTFDPTARILERLLTCLIKQRLTITEYTLINEWKKLLKHKDKKNRLAQLLQVKLRTSSILMTYRKKSNKRRNSWNVFNY
jgi:hypothetical protein